MPLTQLLPQFKLVGGQSDDDIKRTVPFISDKGLDGAHENGFTTQLKELLEIIDNKDADGMKRYLKKIRDNVRRDIEVRR